MKSERACGLDHWTPGNLLNLPIEAREAIVSILSECEKGLVWPHQVMQKSVALLGKSAADDRPISLTSLLYAVYVKIKKPAIADFDRSQATWWDSAVVGNSCLREGIRRRFVSEVACLNGKPCVDTFLDLEKFYDPIDNVKLIQQACQLKCIPVVLKMSLLVHMAPRVLRIGDLWGEWISPCNSILQGLFEFLGQSVAVQAATGLTFPLPCSDWPASRRHQPPQPRYVLSSTSLVC